MALSRKMKIGLVVLGVLLLLGALFGTLAATGVLGGQKKSSNCIDKDDKCAEWAASGECKKNADYMLVNCCASCKSSDEEKTTPTGSPARSPARSPTGSPTVSVPGCTDPDADNYDKTATEDDGSCVYFKSVTPNVESIKEVLSDDNGYKDTYDNALDASGINGKTYYTTSLAASTVSDINDGTVTAENQTSLMFINTPAEDIETTDGSSNLFVAMYELDKENNNNQFILQNFLIGDAAFIKDNVGKYFLVAKVNNDTFAKRIARGNNPATSPNSSIIFGESDTEDGRENLTDDEIDFLEKCTVDTKFYIVTGDENYIKNNVSAIVDRGEELSVAAGT